MKKCRVILTFNINGHHNSTIVNYSAEVDTLDPIAEIIEDDEPPGPKFSNVLLTDSSWVSDSHWDSYCYDYQADQAPAIEQAKTALVPVLAQLGIELLHIQPLEE